MGSGRTKTRKPDAHATSLGELIRRLRVAAGLSQHELALRANVPQRTIASIESGAGGANLETVRRLARGLQVPMGDLDAALPVPVIGDLAAKRRPAGRPKAVPEPPGRRAAS